MTRLDIKRLSPDERLELIGLLRDSRDDQSVPLTRPMAAELDRRLATADSDLSESQPWETLHRDLVRRPS